MHVKSFLFPIQDIRSNSRKLVLFLTFQSEDVSSFQILVFFSEWKFFESEREGIKLREVIPYIGPIPKVIILRLFLECAHSPEEKVISRVAISIYAVDMFSVR